MTIKLTRLDLRLQTTTITFKGAFIYQKQIADAYRRAKTSFLSRHAWSSSLSLQEKERLGHRPLCMLRVN